MQLNDLRRRLRLTHCTVFFLISLLFSCDYVFSRALETFKEIYEPSGVIQSEDGQVVIIEDGGKHPLFISEVIVSAKRLTLKPRRLTTISFAARDFEGIATGKAGDIFAITSHSTKKSGKQSKNRQYLVKFMLEKQQISTMHSFDHLLPYLQKNLEQNLHLDSKTTQLINIEGLVFSATQNELLVGLRAPLHEEKAIILTLKNPYALFHNNSEPVFNDKIILLDLKGAGIRAIDYVKELDRYILAGEVRNTKGKLRSRVWTWDGLPSSAPVELKLPKLKGIENIEGITSVQSQGVLYILMVCDNGDRTQKKGANYVFLDIRELPL